jgi:hypothetical protein
MPTIFSTSLKKINSTLIALSFLALSLLLAVSLSIDVNAQRIGIKPFAEEGEAQQSVFRFTANPGDTITDSVVVTNGSDFEGAAIVNSNDVIYNSGGNISFKENNQESTEVGSWITLVENELNVPAGKGIRVPFTIQIPNDIESGEYAGGITVVPNNPSEDSSGVGVKVRSGLTVYITIPGDLRVDNQVTDLVVINPDLDNFPEELSSRAFITPENMVAKFTAKNNGNMFSRVEGVLRFEFSDGSSEEIPFNRVMNLEEEAREFYIQTRLPYQLGITKISYEYNSSSYNEPDSEFSITENSSGTIDYEFEMTEEDLRTFAEARNNLNEESRQRFGTGDDEVSDFAIEEAEDESDDESDDVPNQDLTTLYYIIGGLGAVILILVIGFILIFLKRKREQAKKAEDASKFEVDSQDTK